MIKNISIISYFLVLYWSLLWISINTHPFEIFYFGESFLKSLNSLRLALPLLSSIFIIFYVFYILILKKFKINKIYLYFFLIFFSQLVGLYFNNERNFDIDDIYLVILSFGVISLFILINYYNLNNTYKYLFTISILFLVLAFFISIMSKFNDIDNLNIYEIFDDVSLNVLSQVNARITGISRILAVINLYILLYFLLLKKKFFKKFIGLFVLLSSILILFMQSRGTILCYFISVIFIVFFYDNNKNKKVKNILIFLIIPFLIYFFTNNYMNKKLYEENSKNHYRIISTDTSGRVLIWSHTFKNYDYTKIFGYGPNGDRFFLKNFNKKQYFGDNTSNIFLYTLVSGGFVSLFFLSLLFYEIFKMLINIVNKEIKTINKKIFLFNLSTVYLIFFSIRSFFENSYGLFSVDFLITYMSISYIITNKKIDYFEK